LAASSTQTTILTTHFAATTFTAVQESALPIVATLKTAGIGLPVAQEWQGWQAGETLVSDTTNFSAVLHVISTFDNGFQPTSQEYTCSSGKSKAVVISSSGDNDVFAMYNVQAGPPINDPGPACCKTGGCGCTYDPNNQNIIPTQHLFLSTDTDLSFYNVRFATTTVDFYLNDLNPANNYTIYIDSIATTNVSGLPSFGFVKTTVVTTVGSHTICLQITGDGTCLSNGPTSGTSPGMPPTTPSSSPTAWSFSGHCTLFILFSLLMVMYD